MGFVHDRLVPALTGLVLLASGPAAAAGPQPLYHGMHWRLIGPFLGPLRQQIVYQVTHGTILAGL